MNGSSDSAMAFLGSPVRGAGRSRLYTYRVMCALAAVLIPAFGVVYRLAGADAADPFWAHLAMSALFAGPALLSFASTRVRRHLGALVRGVLYATVVWYVAVMFANGFAANYVVGVVFVIGATGMAFGLGLERVARLGRFLAFAVVLCSAAVLLAPRPQVSPAILISCVTGAALVVYAGLHLSVRLRKRLVATEQRLRAALAVNLNTTEKRFRAALAGSLDALLLFESQRGAEGEEAATFVLTDLNARAEDLLGQTRQEALGMPLRALLPLYEDAPRFEQVREVARTGVPVEEDIAPPAGSVLAPAWLYQQAVQTEEGVAITLRDISERKEREAETERQKNFYEQVMEAMPPLVVFDREKRFLYLNKHAVPQPELRAWLVGKSNADYFRRRGMDPAHGRRRERYIEQVFETGEAVRFEECLHDRSGHARHFINVLHPIAGLGGEVTQVAGHVLDITERKRAEEQLSASERRYRTLMDAANDAIFVAEAETGLLVDANRRAQALVRRPLEELRGLHQSALHPEGERSGGTARREFERQVAGGQTVSQEGYVVDKDGNRTPVEVSTSIVEVEGRTLAMGIFRDVTARRRYEEQLIEAREHAEEMLRLKTDILNNMSHELRTPLTSILGFSETLADELGGEAQEFAQIVHRSAERLQETLGSVLDMAQLEHGEVAFETSPVTLAEQVEEALPVLRPLAEKKGLTLRTDLQAPDAQACLDEAALHRILQNLAGNAIKFTEEGSVTLAVEADAERVHLRVADTGVGISEDFLPHLFVPFRQQSRGLGREFEGSGLGLAITKHLVDLMDGTIDVESRQGQGTTFTVSFPRQSPLQESPSQAAPQPASRTSEDRLSQTAA